MGLEQVCKNLSITKNIARLIYYTLDKKDRNDLQKQPFSFLRPKYRRKPYDISLGKIATASDNAIKLKEVLTELKDYSYETIQNKLLEQGVKLPYPKIKYAMKSLGVDRNKEMRSSEQSSSKVITKLFAL